MEVGTVFNTQKQYVIFKLNEEYYAANVSYIVSIEKYMPVTRVPMARKSTLGIINLRGEVITIVDVKSILGIPDKQASGSRIMITEISNSKIGMVVDSVVEVAEFTSSMMQDNVMVFQGKNREAITGVAYVNDKYVMVLDMESLLWGDVVECPLT
ncbi:MAG TPA: chemotaxis protein CheW [Candidatus Atribacteria bacterium]|nr:chemotaxis protein CheW [Candidatus Atribacteria bacterium]